MDRRTTLRWMLAASAGMPLARQWAFGEPQTPAGGAAPAGGDAVPASSTAAAGYGTDPDLSKLHRPGDVWPLTLGEVQRRTAAALCDLIIPGDARSPAASVVGVVDFLDEWVSAPYPDQRRDRSTVLEGLGWIDAEAARRFARGFADLADAEQRAICDDICCEAKAVPSRAQAARFFARFRDLTAGGFYSAPEGRRDLGFIGNVQRASFDAPPRELLAKLGLDRVRP